MRHGCATRSSAMPNEVESHEMFGQAARSARTGLGLKPVHQIHDIEEPAPGTVADDRGRDRHGDMSFARPGAADQHVIALLAAVLHGRMPATAPFKAQILMNFRRWPHLRRLGLREILLHALAPRRGKGQQPPPEL